MKKIVTQLVVIAVLIGSKVPQVMAQSAMGGAAGLPTVRIFGLVVDDATGKAMEYATVALRSRADSAIVTGTITNEIGFFNLEKIRPGRYDVEITFIGFTKFIIRDVRANPQKAEIDLGTIRLKPVTIDLNAVTVTGEKKPIEYTLDKKIVNIDNNLATMGGTAADVLATVPSVTVEVDGTVSLRGSADVNILVDGRPSQIISLDEIPASMIERIEIVTNPSARYDPEGSVGIINIVLKKKRSAGYNAVVTVTGGTQNRYNTSLNLNYRLNKTNLFFNYDNRFGRMVGGNTLRRTYVLNDTTSYLNQEGDNRNRMQMHNFRLGMDYDFDAHNTLTISGLFNLRSHNGNDYTAYSSLDQYLDTTDFYTRTNDRLRDNRGVEFNLNYRKTFAQKDREWTADLYYSNDWGNSDNEAVQKYEDAYNLTADWLQNTFSDDIRRSFTIRTDYVHPFNQYSRLEAGYKSDYRGSDADYRVLNFDHDLGLWVNDTNSSNHFIYNQLINAVYGIYTGAFGRFQYQLGMRLEQATNYTDLRTTNQTNRHSYFSVFPSGFLRYRFNDEQGIQLNYSRRINRPYSRALNPFIDYSDPQNLFYGNPDLEPEYIDAFELSNFWETKKGSVYANFYYRQVNDMITRITRLDPSGITYTTFENLNNSRAYGIELTGDYRLTRWWRVNGNWNFYHSELSGPLITQKEAQSITSWNVRLMSMLNLNKTTSFQVFLFYVAPSLSGMGGMGGGGRGPGGHFMSGGGQGRTKSFYSLNLGFRKTFWDNKLTLNVRIQDLFKPNRMTMTTYGDNFTTYSSRWFNSRMVMVGLSYKINEGDRQKKRRQPEQELEYDYEEYQ